MPRVISVHLPCWPTDRLRRQKSTLTPPPDKPFVVATREGQCRIVLAADDAASALGVCPGMSVAHAQALISDLTIADANPNADVAGLRTLAQLCVRHYSPIAAPDPSDGLLIDITGCAHLHGSEARLLDDLLARLSREGIKARAAIADTVGAAHAIARFGPGHGSIIAPKGKLAEPLGKLPIAALRLPSVTVENLVRLGFGTVAALAATPRAPLVRRFGLEITRRLDQAFGHLAEPITPVELPQIERERLSFVEPIGTADALKHGIETLVLRLCATLETKGIGARRLDLLFHRVDGRLETVSIGTANPSRAQKHLSRLLADRLPDVDPGFGVETMMLQAPLTEPLAPKQLASTLGAKKEAPDIATLVDNIVNRIGPKRLYRLAPIESDVPERALQRVPAVSGESNGSWPKSLPRPSRILRRPELVETIALLPDHPPVAFTWRHKARRVRHADGPERIFGEWWRNAAETYAVRDYFRVEDEAGGRYWLFRSGDGDDPRTGSMRWYLHGFFG